MRSTDRSVRSVEMPPNVVLVVTDDQRSESLSVMRSVSSEIADRGVRFETAVVAVPVCGPNRASLLTGQYAHAHGCYTNPRTATDLAPTDGELVGAWLRRAGYRTGLFGKYLNGYGARPAEYVPDGWDAWDAIRGRGGYYDYDLQHNDHEGGREGVVVRHGSDPEDYLVDVVTERARAFIRSIPATTPLFAYVAYNAPHAPFVPAPRHEGSLGSTPPWRPPSYDEDDVSEKPSWLRDRKRWDRATRERRDRERIAQLETLLSVDEGVAELIRTLHDVGRLHDTVIVFTSDNGFLWGEHRLWGKEVPYRAAHEVPLLVRWDARIAQPVSTTVPVSTVDITATVLDLAGATATRPLDGLSLVPLFEGGADLARDRVFFEKRTGGGVPGFCAVRSRSHLFARYATGDEELYDYAAETHELRNRAGDRGYRELATALRSELRGWCRPEPPGMETWA